MSDITPGLRREESGIAHAGAHLNMPEGPELELMSVFDPDDVAHRVSLVKEIVAFANAGGGSLQLGVEEDGTRPGIPKHLDSLFDPARLGDLVGRYISPDSVELEVEQLPADHPATGVVEISVRPTNRPPLVFIRQGNAHDVDGRQTCVFPAHAVYVRRNTKAEPATREDFRGWIDRAVDEERDRWRSMVRLVAELPDDAVLVHVAGDEELEDPSSLLRKAVRTYARNREKLLTARELVELFLARGALRVDDEAFELLVQSALRRKATLFFWLASRRLGSDQVFGILRRALGGSDRDKSDAARAIVQVGSLFLDAAQYGEVIGLLQVSRYQHFREAAAEAPTLREAERLLSETRNELIDGRPARERTVQELVSEAEEAARELLNSERAPGPSRKLARLGLEFLARGLR